MPPSLPETFRTHAAWLDEHGRSPLYAALLRGAAHDLADAEGPVAHLFTGTHHEADQFPQLRLLAALHELVLAGSAPDLAAFFPSAGGHEPPAEAWRAARPVLAEHAGWVRERLQTIVQTNEPGRACALYAGLRHLAAIDDRPIRLLELGASAGINLRFDHFAYRVAGSWLGEPESPLRFEDPWSTPFGAEPRVAERVGCDLAPLDAGDEGDRLRLASYIWPDEPERIARLRAALDVAAANPVTIERSSAADWLTERLAESDDDHLTVVWHSIFWQYLPEPEQRALEAMAPNAATPDRAWLSMEPWNDPEREVRLVLRGPGGAPPQLLAVCDDHGPPLDLRAL